MSVVKSFPVSDAVTVRACPSSVDWPAPRLVIREKWAPHDTDEVIVPLDKVKELIAQLVEATMYLLEEADG